MGLLSLDTEDYQRMLCNQEAREEWLEKEVAFQQEWLLTDGQHFSEVGESMLDDSPCWKIDSLLLNLYVAHTAGPENQWSRRETAAKKLVEYLGEHIQKVSAKRAKQSLKDRENDFDLPYEV